MSFLDRLLEVIFDSGLGHNKFAETAGVAPKTLSSWKKADAPLPRIANLEKVCSVGGHRVQWLQSGSGEKKVTQGVVDTALASNKIHLLHEQEEWSLKEMVSMTMEILESETVYKTALSSNIRAFHKAATEEGKVKKMEEKIISMDQRMERMEKMLVSLGATVPEKRDEEANS